MEKLVQFYSAIPEKVREQYQITFNEDEGKITIRHPFWVYIREGDIDFSRLEDVIRIRPYAVTMYMKHITIVLHLEKGEAQVVMHHSLA